MNVFTGTGHLGRDAEVRQTQNGTSVAGMPIAVNFGFGDSKGTLWLDSSLWGKRAESGLMPYLVKGQQVAVSGELGQRKYTNNAGIEVVVMTLKLAEIDLIGGVPAAQQSQPQQPQQPQRTQPQQQRPAPVQQQQPQYQPEPIDDFDQDIPF